MGAATARRLVVLGAVVLVVTSATAAFAVAGVLDTTFSGDGKQTTDFTTSFDSIGNLVVQPDGKVVAAGWAGGGGGQFALARYNTNGTLDTTFSGDGKQATNFTTGDDYALDVALQSDGKIVAAGAAAGGGGQIAVARYNTNGTLDSTFSGDGKVATNITSGFDVANGVVVQTDGKIVIAGEVAGSGSQFALVRYNTNGTLDTTFSGDGKVATNFTTSLDIAQDVALQSDGKLVAVGIIDVGGGRFALARYNTNGTLDTTFSADGKQATEFTSGFDGASGVAVQPDDKIVVAGWAAGSGGQFAMTRYATDGTLDATFSNDGKQTTNLSTGDDYAMHLALQADGKIVAVGHVAGGGGQFGLVRYNDNGTLDTTFSGDGKQLTNFTAAFDRANSVVIDTAGRIVVGGIVSYGDNGRFGIARYLAS